MPETETFKYLTREELFKRMDEAANVYVVVEISEGNPIQVIVDPADLKDQIIAEGNILGNRLIVQEEELEECIDSDSPTGLGFNLIVGKV